MRSRQGPNSNMKQTDPERNMLDKKRIRGALNLPAVHIRS